MPVGPSAGVPAVDVCAAESLLANVTDSPGLIVIVAGMKQSGSHPGVEEPVHFLLCLLLWKLLLV